MVYLFFSVIPFPCLGINAFGRHYGQSLFEGMKAFECKDGHVRYFHPFQANQARLGTCKTTASMCACMHACVCVCVCMRVGGGVVKFT